MLQECIQAIKKALANNMDSDTLGELINIMQYYCKQNGEDLLASLETATNPVNPVDVIKKQEADNIRRFGQVGK